MNNKEYLLPNNIIPNDTIIINQELQNDKKIILLDFSSACIYDNVLMQSFDGKNDRLRQLQAVGYVAFHLQYGND